MGKERVAVGTAVFFLLALSALGGRAVFAQDGAQKYQAGDFSYIPPKGWKMVTVKGKEYKVATGPIRGGFAPNIDVTVDRSKEVKAADTAEYVKTQLEALKKSFNDLNLIKEEDFTTDLFYRGKRITYEATVIRDKPKVRQTLVFIVLRSRMHIVTCSALAEGGADLDPTFERALKSFRFDQ